MTTNIKLSILLLLFLAANVQGQNCEFKYYNKKGGHYLFSTYYGDDMTIKREGICETKINGELYERRRFKDGLLLEEELNYINSSIRIRTRMRDAVSADGILGISEEFSEKGKLVKSTKFYKDSDKRRCMEITEYHDNENIRSSCHYAFIRLSEIDIYNIKDYPAHTVDRFGYTWLSVPFGKHISYHENAKIAKVEHYKMTFSRYESEHALHGAYSEYYASGTISRSGFYKNGNPDSLWTIFHLNGKLMEKGIYRNNIKFGLWENFDEQGKKIGESYYEHRSSDPFNPIWEKKWQPDGQLIEHKALDSMGTGFVKAWNAKGLLIREAIYSRTGTHVMNHNTPPIFETRWHDNGQLHFIKNYRPRADTIYVSYFPDGKMEHQHLRFRKDETYFEINKSWNEKGILIKDTETIQQKDYAKQSLKFFHENGHPKWTMDFLNGLMTETFFAVNGVKTKSFSRLDGKLQGAFSVFDSLDGHQLIAYHYKDGLRDSICRRYDKEGKLIFERSYNAGCPDKNFKASPKKRTLEEKKLLEKVANYQLSLASERSGNPLSYSLAARDSLAVVFGILQDSLLANGIDKSFDTMSQQTLQFYLPAQLFSGLEKGDRSNPKVNLLYAIFDSLHWAAPKFKLENNVYRAALPLNQIVGNRFVYAKFGEIAAYMQLFRGTSMYMGMEYHCEESVSKATDCLYRFELCAKSMARFNLLIYADGEVEFENQLGDWPQLLENGKITNPIQNYRWKD